MYIQLQNIHSEEKEVWDGDFELIYREVFNRKDTTEKYPWLNSIDVYDHTLFNSRQTPLLVKELEILKTEVSNQTIRDEIDKLIIFIKDLGVGRFVHVVGD